MGERKRREQKETPQERVAKALSRKLIEDGLYIQSGFEIMMAMAFPDGCSETQRNEMRNAFFGGAQHLFGALMTVLDPEEDITDADMKKMESIDTELRQFIEEFTLRHYKTEGTV